MVYGFAVCCCVGGGGGVCGIFICCFLVLFIDSGRVVRLRLRCDVFVLCFIRFVRFLGVKRQTNGDSIRDPLYPFWR